VQHQISELLRNGYVIDHETGTRTDIKCGAFRDHA